MRDPEDNPLLRHAAVEAVQRQPQAGRGDDATAQPHGWRPAVQQHELRCAQRRDGDSVGGEHRLYLL